MMILGYYSGCVAAVVVASNYYQVVVAVVMAGRISEQGMMMLFSVELDSTRIALEEGPPPIDSSVVVLPLLLQLSAF